VIARSPPWLVTALRDQVLGRRVPGDALGVDLVRGALREPVLVGAAALDHLHRHTGCARVCYGGVEGDAGANVFDGGSVETP